MMMGLKRWIKLKVIHIRVMGDNSYHGRDKRPLYALLCRGKYFRINVDPIRAGLRELEALGEVNLVAPNEIEK